MRGLVLAMVAIAPVASAAPVERDPMAEIAAATVREDRFPETPAHFADGIVALPNVEYANLVGYRPLTLDLYVHAGRADGRRRPLVIWVHGGGWSRGDARSSAAFADWPGVLGSLAARGYVVASVNYRLSGEARYPAAIKDVRAALRHLRANAGAYGIDPDRVILWGGSAGAYLATMAGLTCADPAFAPEPSTGRAERGDAVAASTGADCVQAIVAWYGPFDLSEYRSANVAALLGCRGDCTARARAASPVAYVSGNAPPMLLIHGTGDTTIAASQSRVMAERLRAAGGRVETLFIPGADHGWMRTTPAGTRDAHLAVLRESFAFMDMIAQVTGPDATAR